MSRRISVLMLLCGGMLACAPTLPPTALTQAEALPASAAMKEASEQAPIAFAQAEKLRRQSRAAFEAGDFASSQLLAEEALAAYEGAMAEARVARAEDATVRSRAEADKARERLASIDAQQLKLQSEIDALNKQLQVLRALEVPRDSGKASADRARARLTATKTLRLQAQLLCTAAGLLQAQGGAKPTPATGEATKDLSKAPTAMAALSGARKQLAELDKLMAGKPAQPPIDHAMHARAGCLEALTLFRRGRQDVSKAPGAADALLADLGAGGFGLASRDDRGVVVTLRDLFSGTQLVAGTGDKLAKMAAVVSKHGALPVVVVLHQQRSLDDKARQRAAARGAALVAELRRRMKGQTIGEAVLAGINAPIVDPEGRHKARNARVEIVFVTPEA